jgi:hypothetical protein
VAHVVKQYYCKFPSQDDPIERCQYDDIFILERELEDTRPQDFKILYQSPTWRSKTLETNMNNELQSYWQEGFLPKYIFSKNELFLDRESFASQASSEQIEIKYVTGGKWKKQINELAQQGYRLLCISYENAIMVRKRGETAPTAYIFLDTESKSFDAQLAEQQRKKSIHRMVVGKYFPVFEQPQTNELKTVEYKILQFRLQEDDRPAERKTYYTLDKESQEREKELNALVREGFQVLDMFTTFDRKEKEPENRQKGSVLLGRFS